MQKLLNLCLLCTLTSVPFVAMAEENNAQTTVQTLVQTPVKKTEGNNAQTTIQTPVEKNGQTQIAKFEKYTNTEKGYSLEYPSDWKKSDVPQLDFVLFAPTENNERAHASLNVVSEKVGMEINLEQFFNESTKNLASALKEVKIEKTGSAKLNGIEAKWVQYTHVLQGMTFRVLQYFIVSSETIYLITFSASEEDFDKYRKDAEHIASTFKILK